MLGCYIVNKILGMCQTRLCALDEILPYDARLKWVVP